MARNKVVSAVSRMPFDGIRSVRPAALRGAMAARHGDLAAVAESDQQIREVSRANWLFAGIGATMLAANAVFAVRQGSAVHGAEATFGGLVLAGHTAAAYTQQQIREQIQTIASRRQIREVAAVAIANAAVQREDQPVTPAEHVPEPDFYTPSPRFARTIDAAVTYGSVVTLGHTLFAFLQAAGQQAQ